LAISSRERRDFDKSIATRLHAEIGPVKGKVVSAYWPFRGEPNLHPFMKEVHARGGHCALPVVVRRGEPLVFRSWSPGDPLDCGVWNIPIPKAGARVLVPDVVIAPVVGFDRACYRLGYGGGFYDRTLAALPERPHVYGVGYSFAAIPTIYPQWHDVPMDLVVTEAGLVTAVPDGTFVPE
jgi:5,10-methenyltetrahydrofolate synthetase